MPSFKPGSPHIDVVKKARAVISLAPKWHKGSMAARLVRDATNGEFLVETVNLNNATCFCGIGAVVKAANDNMVAECDRFVNSVTAVEHPMGAPSRETEVLFRWDHIQKEVVDHLHYLAAKRGYTSFGEFNDDPSTKHQDVLEVFDQIIKECE